MQKIIVEFNPNEVNALLSLIHIATQAKGIEVAEAAVVLTRKIQASAGGPALPTKDEPDTKEPEPAVNPVPRRANSRAL